MNNIDKFDINDKEKSLVELHKTDYNNYSDLSHFVEEYYKAQALINECQNFYKSFFLSKLLTYSKLTNTSYKENEYNFFNIKITGLPLHADTFNLYNEFEGLDDSCKGTYNYKSLLGYERLAYSRAMFKFKEQCDKSRKKLFTIHITLEQRYWMPHCDCKENAYYFSFNGFILKKYKEEHFITTYGNLEIYPKSESKRIDKEGTLKLLLSDIIGDKSIYDYMRELTSSYKEEFYKIYKEELKTVLKQINVPIIHIDINNDLKDVAYSCYKSYIKSVKKADLNEEIVKLSKTYESDGEYVDLLISEIFTNDEIDKMIDNIAITPWTGHLDNDILEYINKNYYNKIIDLTKTKMADATYAYRTIIRECSEYNKNQKLYIIGKHNQSHYFCDQKDVDKININLNNRKLICTYTKTSKHLKYRWPSDAPYVVTELTRQVIFDVDNNSVCDFNESENTYEISRDKYY